MKHILIVMCLLSGIALNGFSQTAAPDSQRYNFTIQDCINYAYEHQDSVVNANLDVKSAGYRVKETIGQGFPQIHGVASFQDYLKIPTTLLPGEFFGQPGTFIPIKFGVKYQSNLSLTASQILFDPDYLVGLQARNTYKELYDRSLTRSKISTAVNVTKAYYQVLVSVEQLKVLQADIDQLKQQMDETIARNKQGFVEKIDVDRITVQYNSLVTRKENVVRLLGLGYQLLKFQIGMPIDNVLLLKDRLEDIKLEASLSDPVADTAVYRNRVEYSLLETQSKLYQYDVKRKKGQFLPKLTANVGYSASYQDNNFGQLYRNNFPSAYVGLTLNVPIFTGFQHINQLRQSEITLLKSQNDMFAARNAFNLELKKARITYLNGLQTLNDQKRNRALAEEVLRVSKIKYQQGVGSSLEVTQAQTALQDADNSYIQGLYDALVSKVDLDQAYGRIK
ncbi:TolC family protein [Mucilaginibacter sp. L3T2-6]|uniref:TolC family protein n=1 Tax=Mucilaginibacter sp. L3T2-6 TaxID=3062491 RepID=UPI0026749A53|nr:TolC family protein [Mucilaginibacter sp. L3T2-6]MDO3643037.1 TolC family protein [Mucilaginibacter sp. L3T2-6]MDV6215804.1 TolC family protein [Mucilaginibacter sp. L3T2-6]